MLGTISRLMLIIVISCRKLATQDEETRIDEKFDEEKVIAS